MSNSDRAIATGSRVFIRPPLPHDQDEFVSFVRASQRFYAGLVSPPDTEEAFKQWLAKRDGERHASVLVCRITDEAIVGVYNLSEIVRGPFESAYLGYYANAAYAGRGYMREGLTLLLDWAFTELGLHRVEANIQPHNESSIFLAERAGFRKEGFSPRYLRIEGEWHDHLRYAITVEDWQDR